jgi:orotidine-5'-phosphate decarboxylase
MGLDTAEPFFKYEDKLVFVLGLTSNPGSADIQRIIADGEPLYKKTIREFAEHFPAENLGFVVGATHPGELAELRQMLPKSTFLIPGIGTQGGNAEEVLKANNAAPAVINVSRAIIYASKEADFTEKIRAKALEYKNQLKAG